MHSKKIPPNPRSSREFVANAVVRDDYSPTAPPSLRAVAQGSPVEIPPDIVPTGPIEQLLEVGASLSRSGSLRELLNLILAKSREITCSDAGSIYLVDRKSDTSRLLFQAAQNDSQPVPFEEYALPVSDRSLAGYVALSGETLNLPDAYRIDPDLPYCLDRSFDRNLLYRTRSVLVLPMQNQAGETIGVLQLINRKVSFDIKLSDRIEEDEIVAFREWDERVARSLAGQAAILIERHQLQQSVENSVEVFSQAKQVIQRLLEIGTALSSASELDELLALILSKSREITCSDAGSVYLVDRNPSGQSRLFFKVVQNDSLDIPFQESIVPLDPESLAGYVASTGKSVNLADAYDPPAGAPYRLNRNFDRELPYRTKSVLVLPMVNRQGQTIGVLQLINRRVRSDLMLTPDNVDENVTDYSAWEERVVRALAAQAAISIERNQLEESIEQLFEGFVTASVRAIEARDPSTSSHSFRVAELTVRLAEEASTISFGPLRSLRLNDRQIKAVRYAALLHDFGKVGVPEAILTKSKKLFPAHLDNLRQRFALVRRTLEMECAQAKFRHLLDRPLHRHERSEPGCPHCESIAKLDRELEAELDRLDTYWEVLERANEPQVLAEEPLAMLQELARYTYRDVNGEARHLVTETELEQLCIRRGTLTAGERLAIESHVTHTYEFLKRIPWTGDLAEVPLVAYGHHEKLDGSGYPRGLRATEIPVQAQMITIADIYDALTARDRPYKKSLPVAIALKILREEASMGKINADLLDLFEQRQAFSVVGHALAEENASESA